MSPIIYEVLDVGTGITDPHGELVSSGAGIPTFVGVLDKAVKRIVDLHGLDKHPRRRLLHHQRPLLWRRHASERRGHRVAGLRRRRVRRLGGIDRPLERRRRQDAGLDGGRRLGDFPGRPAPSGREAVRAAASRSPRSSTSSRPTRACRISCAAICGRRSRRAARPSAHPRRLVETYGIDAYRGAIASLFIEGERRGRAGLAALAARHIPHRGRAGRRRDLARRDHHFAGPLQRRPPRQPEAAHRALQHQPRRRGDLLPDDLQGADRPDAVCQCRIVPRAGGDHRAGHDLPCRGHRAARLLFRDAHPAGYDMLWQCMARALPERLPAGHFASICGTVLAGTHPDTGRRFTMVEPQMGGWGATAAATASTPCTRRAMATPSTARSRSARRATASTSATSA